MINKDISGATQPEKKDASGCVAQGGADQPEAARFLGAQLREIREKTGLGRRTVAAEKLGFNHNTIASYETALSLPDIDFLVVFADKTGADLNELLRLRLQASRYPTVRALAHGFMLRASPAPVEESEPPMSDSDKAFAERRDWSMLEAVLRVCEHKLQAPLTADVADKIDALVTAWSSADMRPDLKVRMERVRISTALMRP